MTDNRTFSHPESALGSASYPVEAGAIPTFAEEVGSYQVRFAKTAEDLDQILKLRYQIFNLELGEGLDESHRTGRDEDDLDGRMHHLMILTRSTGAVVGTYRMQTSDMAARYGGFYSAEEFEVANLPPAVVASSVEIGRACVAREHRNGRVLSLLWRGLAEYLVHNYKHYLFGCCSLTSQDEALGVRTHAHLEHVGAVHPTLLVNPRPDCRCQGEPSLPGDPEHIPALFQSYLSLGAKVLGPPAIDRRFKTIDWLVIIDTRDIDIATHRRFFR